MRGVRILSLLSLSSGGLGPAGAAQDVGSVPPPIEARAWLNHAGAPPTLAGLRGQTVIVHFWRVKDADRLAAFNVLRKFHHDHADKGLVILAVTDEPAHAVEKFLERDYLPFAIGTGSSMFESWDVRGDFWQVTLAPSGEVFFAGPANGLWNGKLLKGLKGSERLGERQVLKLVPEGEFDRRSRKTLGRLAQGELGKALADVERLLASTSADDAARHDAQRLEQAIEDHVMALMGQVERNVERREALPVEQALEALTDDLEGHPLGQGARDRREELSRDPLFQAELEAARELEELMVHYYRRGWEKNVARAEKLVEDYPDTKAAERAAAWLRKRWL